MAATAGNSVQAALNLLREQLRAVADTRRQILMDRDLERDDPDHRRQLLIQTRIELGEIARAVGLLERVEAGTLIEVPAGPFVFGQWNETRLVLSAPDAEGAA